MEQQIDIKQELRRIDKNLERFVVGGGGNLFILCNDTQRQALPHEIDRYHWLMQSLIEQNKIIMQEKINHRSKMASLLFKMEQTENREQRNEMNQIMHSVKQKEGKKKQKVQQQEQQQLYCQQRILDYEKFKEASSKEQRSNVNQKNRPSTANVLQGPNKKKPKLPWYSNRAA